MRSSNKTRLRAVIVDDEKPARDLIARLLSEHDDIELVGECAEGRQAVAFLNREGVDLVFLDVQMPHMDGFEVLKQLDPRRFPVVIFVTAYDQYAVRAFDCHALDYLLKPFRRERFAEALQRARERIKTKSRRGNFRSFRSLLEHWDAPAKGKSSASDDLEFSYKQRIFVKTGRHSISVEVAQVDWIKSVDHFVELHCRGKSHLVYTSLGELESQLDPVSFLRVHRTTIVNIAAIKEFCIEAGGACLVLLRDGSAHRVSRIRRRWLQARLGLK